MKKQSRIENLISKFLLLHDRKIDLSLNRINSIPAFEITRRLDKIKNINNKDFEKLENLNIIYK